MAEARTLELEPAVAIERMASAGAGRCRPTIRLSRRSGSAWFCSISARRTPPTTGRCGATSSEFLSDKRVIDYPTWLWQPLLQLVILSKRPASKGKDYDRSGTRSGTRAR